MNEGIKREGRGRKREGPGLYDGLYGEAEASPERGIFFRLQVYKRIGIPEVEVYKRVGKSIILVFKKAFN